MLKRSLINVIKNIVNASVMADVLIYGFNKLKMFSIIQYVGNPVKNRTFESSFLKPSCLKDNFCTNVLSSYSSVFKYNS